MFRNLLKIKPGPNEANSGAVLHFVGGDALIARGISTYNAILTMSSASPFLEVELS
jgi:hypothetical protein